MNADVEKFVDVIKEFQLSDKSKLEHHIYQADKAYSQFCHIEKDVISVILLHKLQGKVFDWNVSYEEVFTPSIKRELMEKAEKFYLTFKGEKK